MRFSFFNYWKSSYQDCDGIDINYLSFRFRCFDIERCCVSGFGITVVLFNFAFNVRFIFRELSSITGE